MIILAFYVSNHATGEWLHNFGKHLEVIDMPKMDIIPIILPSGDVKEGGARVECIYPRYAFEYEEKESEDLREIIEKLEERLRMPI